MNYNFINTSDIEISDNLNMMVYEVGEDTKHKVLVIDNLLKNPEDIVSILKNQYFESEGYDFTFETNLKFPNIKKVIHRLAEVYYNIDHVEDSSLNKKIKFELSLIKGGSSCLSTDIIPHIDTSMISFSLFLNLGENPGGMGFFKHRKSNIDYDISNFDDSFNQSEPCWHIQETKRRSEKHQFETIFDSRNIDEDDWELEFVSNAKFNRIVIYPSYMFHSYYIEKDWYTQDGMLNLQGFVL